MKQVRMRMSYPQHLFIPDLLDKYKINKPQAKARSGFLRKDRDTYKKSPQNIRRPLEYNPLPQSSMWQWQKKRR